jgi:hypothetical protein
LRYRKTCPATAERFTGVANNGTGFVIRIDPPAQAQCFGDVNADQSVNISDVLQVISSWGACPPTGDCMADVDGNVTVDVGDLLSVISAWGDCP